MKPQSLWPTITFNYAPRDIKLAIREAIKESGKSPEQALDLVNEMARAYGVQLIKGNGKELTLDSWEKWLNPADDTRVPSCKALAVICAALQSLKPMAPLVELAGGALIDAQDAKLLAWAKAYKRAREARQEMKQLEDIL